MWSVAYTLHLGIFSKSLQNAGSKINRQSEEKLVVKMAVILEKINIKKAKLRIFDQNILWKTLVKHVNIKRSTEI